MNTELLQNIRTQSGALLASIHGEIDLHTSPDLRGQILRMLDAHKSLLKVVLNLGDVPYMDSSAIAVLVETMQKLRKTKGQLYLTNLQPRVKSLLEIARLETIFVLCADEATALAK
jgi:anti-sigma B factor antagonist